MCRATITAETRKQRETHQQAVQRFLDQGGTITQLPAQTFAKDEGKRLSHKEQSRQQYAAQQGLAAIESARRVGA